MIGDVGIVVCVYVFIRMVELVARPREQTPTLLLLLAVGGMIVSVVLGLDVLLQGLRGVQPAIR